MFSKTRLLLKNIVCGYPLRKPNIGRKINFNFAHSAEKSKRWDPLAFLNIHSDAKYQKN